jgi:hypothetical protein
MWDGVLAWLLVSPGGKLVNRPIRKRVPNLSANSLIRKTVFSCANIIAKGFSKDQLAF